MEEIESALSGRIESLPDSVILGKIRHLKNTLEVCCQNSGAADFTGYGWTLAKDYATKLNDEIEQGKRSSDAIQKFVVFIGAESCQFLPHFGLLCPVRSRNKDDTYMF